MMAHAPQRAVLFDLDGTLVDSLDDIAMAAQAVRTATGLPPLAVDRVRSFVGDGARRLVARTLADDPQAPAAAAGGDPALDAAMAHFHAAYSAGLVRSTRCYPGIPDLLARLQAQGQALAVVTNKPEGYSHAILEALGLARYFSVVVGGDSLPVAKPAAAPVLHALAALGVPAASGVMVGDGRNDVLAAAAAGVASVLVTWGYDCAGALASGATAWQQVSDTAALAAVLLAEPAAAL